MAKLVVHRRAYKRRAYKKKTGTTVPATRVRKTTYLREDIGLPGRGPKVIPVLHKGGMNAIAKEMGYTSSASIPKSKIPLFARKLIKHNGEKKAKGMAQAQATFRKRERGPDATFFRELDKEVRKQVRSTPGWK